MRHWNLYIMDELKGENILNNNTTGRYSSWTDFVQWIHSIDDSSISVDSRTRTLTSLFYLAGENRYVPLKHALSSTFFCGHTV